MESLAGVVGLRWSRRLLVWLEMEWSARIVVGDGKRWCGSNLFPVVDCVVECVWAEVEWPAGALVGVEVRSDRRCRRLYLFPFCLCRPIKRRIRE